MRRSGVVVDDDHHRTVFPAAMLLRASQHIPPVSAPSTDDGNYVAILTRQREGLREAVGIGQRGGSVRGLDPVVFALGAARIPDSPPCLRRVSN